MPRPHRFCEFSTRPQATDLLVVRTFYADGQLEERMARVRRTIVLVRQTWDTARRQLADQLMRWLEEEAAAAKATVVAKQEQLQQHQVDDELAAWSLVLSRWRAILSVDRNWADLRQCQQQGETPDAADDFGLLREYTNERSYKMVFSPVLQAMRSGDDDRVTMMVYLIELINIDLFNYEYSRLQRDSPSRAYRGMSMSEADWLSYRRLLDRPVASRFIAVPLALTSTSRSRDVALQFIANKQQQQQQQEQQQQGQEQTESIGSVPCLIVIHVISVPDSLMELYKQRFPQSVVSTICAVDITDLSNHPDEQEILLRGAFFQLLSLEGPREFLMSAPAEAGQQPTTVTTNVKELLVINANRDHLSNGRLGDQDAPARALFAAIVRVTRYRYCLSFCRERNMPADAAEYEAALQGAELELKTLTG